MTVQFQPPPQSANITQPVGQVPSAACSPQWFNWFLAVWTMLNYMQEGYTGTITTAKLTTGGSNGSMTFQNGVLVSETAAS